MFEKTKQIMIRLKLYQIIFLLLLAGTFLYVLMAGRSIDNIPQGKSMQVKEGLTIRGKNFTIEGQDFRILSGAIHYFRVPKDYWDDRLLKLKAMGLNTVETYIPWNVHEPEPGVYDFDGDLSISDFILLAQTFGLYVIIRPGPYICAEWDLGGLPSWLLRDPDMQLRSSYKPFLHAVDRYFDKLIPILAKHQFSKGGPVIAFQVENEYGSYGSDVEYLRHLKKGFRKRGIDELLFVCDNSDGLGRAHLKGTLQTINFQTHVDEMIDKLEKHQPNKPVFVTEFWSGWFDHWGEKHHTVKIETVANALKKILDRGASFNFYVFHGGTNFGFLNGANTKSRDHGYLPTISSYDYDAPVSEIGEVTEKYRVLRDVIIKHAPTGSVPNNLEYPHDSHERTNYGPIVFSKYMPLKDLLNHINGITSKNVMPMEMLPIKKDCGQAYGYTLYSTKIPDSARKVTIHDAADRVIILVNHVIINDVQVSQGKHVVKLTSLEAGLNRLDILVENCGRINYEHAIDDQRKGIRGWVDVNDKKHQHWEIFPLEFKDKFMSSLEDSQFWKAKIPNNPKSPALYKGSLFVQRVPNDCILFIKDWERGAVFINGKNLGRYDARGPQRTLYVPRSFLKSGDNSVILFESGKAADKLQLETISDVVWDESVDFHI